MKRLPDKANNDYTVRLGFSYSNQLRTRGHYKIHILDALGRDVDLGVSKETSDGYYADHNKAIEAAQSVAEKFGLPLDLNGFEAYNDSFGKIDTARVRDREWFDWGVVWAVCLLVLAFIGAIWLIVNVINGTSTLI